MSSSFWGDEWEVSMPRAEGDNEIRALKAVFDALQPLDDDARSRVLDYTLKRLGMRELPTTGTAGDTRPEAAPEERPTVGGDKPAKDIRALGEEKNPTSAIEMAAIVAYYLSEAAPEQERKATVSAKDLEKYFKQAQYPLPRRLDMALINGASAGYFDSVGRGKYQLNPVGYNLVTQSLPRGTEKAPRGKPARKRAATRRKSSPRAKRTTKASARKRTR